MPVGSRGERCRHGADIFDIIEGAAYLDRELLAGIDAHSRRCVRIDREEVFGPVSPHGAAPTALQTRGDSSQGLGILQSRGLGPESRAMMRTSPHHALLTAPACSSRTVNTEPTHCAEDSRG